MVTGLLLRDGLVDRNHLDWRRLNCYFAWNPTPDQERQSAVVLRELRAREKAARECGVTSVWDSAVELALSQSMQIEHDEHTETTESTDTSQTPPFGIDLSQPFEFDWVDHDFTNFCGDAFVGRLDYILPDRSTLCVARVAPMPQFAHAAMATGWPCPGHPSDHVSLLYDLVPPPLTDVPI